MQNRIGPDRAGPVRLAPDPRRRHQALLQGAVGAQHRRPARSSASRRTSSLLPAFLAFCDRAHRRRRHHRRAPDVPPARRPPVRRPLAARDVGPRPLRRHARRLVVGLEVPAARLGARRRRSCSATKPRSALAIVGVLVQANTLSTRGIVVKQGWHGIESIFNGDWYWLPAIVALVIFVIAADRRDQPPAVRPRRGGAGAHRRVLHRVHRHPVRDLLPRRVHEPHHDVGDRGDALLRRPVGPGARLPRRQRLVQRVDHAGVLVHVRR